MSQKTQHTSLLNFDSRSAVLFAALAVGGIAGACAQTSQQPDARPTTSSTSPWAAIGPSGTAPAKAHAAQDIASIFTRLDTNHDGKLSLQEAQGMPALSPRFSAIDTDHNKFISKAEFETAMAPT